VKAGHIVLAYHGCDAVIRDKLVSGRVQHLNPSKNQYDWLGPGAYFFEDDYQRALMFAQASKDNPDKRYTVRPIVRPAVVGAILQVQHWLDMTTQEGIQEFAEAYQPMLDWLSENGKRVPTNEPASPDDTEILLRGLDNAVFSYIHSTRDKLNDPELPPFQAVRGAFPQGKAALPGSTFLDHTHVQLALRDNACIKGWFLPVGAALMDPASFSVAEAELEAATKAYAKSKPRKVAR
jgi:hypothetical protein